MAKIKQYNVDIFKNRVNPNFEIYSIICFMVSNKDLTASLAVS